MLRQLVAIRSLVSRGSLVPGAHWQMSHGLARLGVVWLGSSLLVGAAHAGVYASATQRAADWLESQQSASDGSWRDTSEARTFLQTTEAVLALHQANRRRNAYYAGQTWLENHDPKNLDARARRLVVLRATQSSAQPDIDGLLTAVTSPAAGQSGWGLAKRYRASALDTALALDALRTAGATFNSSQAIAYLKATQITTAGNEGWSAAGGSINAYATARVIQALAAYKAADATLTTPLAKAVAALKTQVTTSSAPHLRAAAALAYLRMDPASNDAKTLLNSLTAIQRPGDGGFDAGVFATGLIVQAFAAAEGVDATTSRERVDVSDAALRTAINEALGRGSMDQLNRGELSQLTTLDISNRGVTSLNGLQFASNLSTLNAANNLITDTSPLAGLSNLTNTNLAGNPCSGCGGGVQVAEGDTPLPLWALLALGAGLMGAVGRAGRRSKTHE